MLYRNCNLGVRRINNLQSDQDKLSPLDSKTFHVSSLNLLFYWQAKIVSLCF